ncbi:hypothetical protein ACA910_019374 [Epithemia clementina (nom. ined.)]
MAAAATSSSLASASALASSYSTSNVGGGGSGSHRSSSSVTPLRPTTTRGGSLLRPSSSSSFMVGGGGGGGGGTQSTSSSTFSSLSSSRPPVLLEFTETTLRCGLVGDACPRDIIPLSLFFATTTTTTTTSTTARTRDHHHNNNNSSGAPQPSLLDSPDVWYRYLAPLLKYAYQRLGLLGTNVVRDRKALLLFQEHDDSSLSYGVHQAVVGAVLLGTLGVPAVHVVAGAAWSRIPYSLPQLRSLLVVYLGLSDASCVVHAAGETLPFTYQRVSLQDTRNQFQQQMSNPAFLPSTILTTSTTTTTTTSASTSVLDQATYLDLNNPNSVLVAILKALEACPRTERPAVVANLVFAGTGLLAQPHVPLLITQQLKAVLQQAAQATRNQTNQNQSTRRRTRPPQPQPTRPPPPPATSSEPESPPPPPPPSQEEEEDDDNDEEEEDFASAELAEVTSSSFSSLVSIPLALSALAGSLAESVGLVQTVVNPDLLSWVGASQWAQHWYGRDPLLSNLTWHIAAATTKNNKTNTNTTITTGSTTSTTRPK